MPVTSKLPHRRVDDAESDRSLVVIAVRSCSLRTERMVTPFKLSSVSRLCLFAIWEGKREFDVLHIASYLEWYQLGPNVGAASRF